MDCTRKGRPGISSGVLICDAYLARPWIFVAPSRMPRGETRPPNGDPKIGLIKPRFGSTSYRWQLLLTARESGNFPLNFGRLS